MKFYLVTFGSRGDIEPFHALALEASSAGHEVFFAHTADFEAQPDVPYIDIVLPGSVEKVIADQGVSVWKALLSYSSVMEPMLRAVWEASTRHIREIKPDMVVYHPKVVTAATAAHSVGALAALVEIVPTMTPTRQFPPAGFPGGLPASLNKAAYGLVKLGTSAFSGTLSSLRRELGVIRSESDLVVCPVSPSLVPQPGDWPPYAHVTGHWNVPSQASLDHEMLEFVSDGPILYAGFGSMRDSRGLQRASAIVGAGRILGMKTILTTGWGGLVPTPDHMVAPDVLVRKAIPHAALLGHVDLAVHHGGAGTTHAMVRAGVPSVIMPFLADQPWWAARLASQNLGPEALPRTTTNPDTIARALTKAQSFDDVVSLAGLRMATEDGLANTVRILEEAEVGTGELRKA